MSTAAKRADEAGDEQADEEVDVADGEAAGHDRADAGEGELAEARSGRPSR